MEFEIGIWTLFFFFFFFLLLKKGGFYGYVSFMMGREGRGVRFFFWMVGVGFGEFWMLGVACVSGAAQVGRLDRRM